MINTQTNLELEYVTRDNAPDPEYARKQRISKLSNIVIHATETCVEAITSSLSRAVAECALYNESPALYGEYVAQKRSERQAELQQSLLVQ